ncbi:MAG TPA: hydroxymethylbilane synthase [Terriglobia bacterium]|nr:hydroxymethylbilane synthase [Terriglobia bacterium]
MKIIIGSRGSALALWQSNWVRDRLAAAGHEAEVRVIRTSGDRLPQAALAASGVKGLFIKEIEEALAAGSIQLAVHSLKDMPTDLPPGLKLAAVPEREDARDVLVSNGGLGFAGLASGQRVGSSSVRRQSQLLHLRPGLKMLPVRGNIDTRLRKLDEGEFDALVLAAAGLARLGFGSRIREYFSIEQLCPAAGQGALGIETREASGPVAEAAASLDHPPAHAAVRAERALLRALGGGCAVPIAAYAASAGESLALRGVVASPSGERLLRANASGPATEPEKLGLRVADDLRRQGADEILGAR